MRPKRFLGYCLIFFLISQYHILIFGVPFGRLSLSDIHQHLSVLNGGSAEYSPAFYWLFTRLGLLLGANIAYSLMLSVASCLPAEAAGHLAYTLHGNSNAERVGWLIVWMMGVPGFVASTGTFAAALSLSSLVYGLSYALRAAGTFGHEAVEYHLSSLLLISSSVFHTAGAYYAALAAVLSRHYLAAFVVFVVILTPITASRGYVERFVGEAGVERGFFSIGTSLCLYLLLPLYYAADTLRRRGFHPAHPILVPLVIFAVIASPLDSNLRPLIHAGTILAAVGANRRHTTTMCAWAALLFLIYFFGTIGENGVYAGML